MTAPIELNRRKREKRMRKIPASGGAAVERPGTNFATSSERAPWRERRSSGLRTHESGSSETRHRKFMTFPPPRRPISYHSVSARSEARSAAARAGKGFIPTLRASAPAAKSAGSAGIGRPSCSASTHTKSTRGPCLTRNSLASFTIGATIAQPGPQASTPTVTRPSQSPACCPTHTAVDSGRIRGRRAVRVRVAGGALLATILLVTGPADTVDAGSPRNNTPAWARQHDGPAGNFDEATAIATSPDGTKVFVTGFVNGIGPDEQYSTLAYDAATGQELWTAHYNGSPCLDTAVAIAASPDGT